MKKWNKVRFLTIGGILTTITVLFQSAPVFFPAIGLLLSPFSTLPIAIAAFFNISLGVAVYFSSAILLTFVSLQEVAIFLFTTGLLGIAIGTFLFRKGILVSVLFSFILLTLGMMTLTYFVRIPVFGDFTRSISISGTFLIFSSFSLIYVSIWNRFVRKLIRALLIAHETK